MDTKDTSRQRYGSRHSSGKKGLPCPGRAVEENTFRWFDADTLEKLGIEDRELNHLE